MSCPLIIIDRGQLPPCPITSRVPAHIHDGDSQKLTLTDPRAPQLTLLTLLTVYDQRCVAFCKLATSQLLGMSPVCIGELNILVLKSPVSQLTLKVRPHALFIPEPAVAQTWIV